MTAGETEKRIELEYWRSMSTQELVFLILIWEDMIELHQALIKDFQHQGITDPKAPQYYYLSRQIDQLKKKIRKVREIMDEKGPPDGRQPSMSQMQAAVSERGTDHRDIKGQRP